MGKEIVSFCHDHKSTCFVHPILESEPKEQSRSCIELRLRLHQNDEASFGQFRNIALNKMK
jgi:hypothetical protein